MSSLLQTNSGLLSAFLQDVNDIFAGIRHFVRLGDVIAEVVGCTQLERVCFLQQLVDLSMRVGSQYELALELEGLRWRVDIIRHVESFQSAFKIAVGIPHVCVDAQVTFAG